MDSLRRPVPRNQFVPAMGVPVELNDPPKLPTVPGKPEPANFTPRVARQGVAHLFEGGQAPYSTKEGTATCGKALGELLFTTRGQTGDWNTAGCQPTRTTIPET